MRDGETAGKDYHFVSEDDFVRRVVEGAFLEHASVHGHWYGTLRSEVDARIAAGDTVLLVIDVQGARRLRESGEPMTSIFILPPSREVLRQRLESRATETRESVERRLRAAEEELAERHHYEFLVVNDDLERAVREVEGILFTGNLPAGGGSTPDPDRVRKGK
jgi:guanylate kinase